MGIFSRNGAPEQRATAAPYNATRPITASAARIDISKKNELETLKKRLSTTSWQGDAWDFYDLIGEIQFSANLIANVASRIRLFPGWITSADTAPSNIFDIKNDEQVTDELKQAALETLRALESGPGGIPGLLRDAALNLFIAGECYLIQEPAAEGGSFGLKTWQIRSVNEIIIEGDGPRAKVKLKSSRTQNKNEYVTLEGVSTSQVGRIWRNHPRYSDEADSSMRPQLENCDMLLLYDRAKRSIVKSRLNAGLLYLPDGLANAAGPDGEGEFEEDQDPTQMAPMSDAGGDEVEEEIMDALGRPIGDESAASAAVPYILRGPLELGAGIRHITFERKFDPQISSDAERILERILAGLDLPKDVVSGVGSAKYANAVVIEESLYKAHIEPLILTIVDALSAILLRPVLKSLGFNEDQLSRVTIWYDPSAITTKPDKATAASQGYEMGIISEASWRRANGFGDSDAPDGIEKIQRMAQTKGILNEAIVEAALRTLAPDLFDRVRQASAEQTDTDTQEAVSDALDGNANEDFAEPEPDDSPEPPAGLIEP